MMRALLMLVPVATGVASGLQAATNSGMALRTSLPTVILINILGTLACVAALMLLPGGRPIAPPAGTPWVFFLGGLYGFIIIAGLAFAFPRFGGAWTIALVRPRPGRHRARGRPLRAAGAGAGPAHADARPRASALSCSASCCYGGADANPHGDRPRRVPRVGGAGLGPGRGTGAAGRTRCTRARRAPRGPCARAAVSAER